MGQDWSKGFATEVGKNIASLRKAAGLSAQRLSDRCAEIGYPIPRSTLANIESGRKRDIPIQEILVVAAALGVPPARVVVDPFADSLEVLPQVERKGIEVVEWISGNWPLLPERGLRDFGTLHRWLSRDTANRKLLEEFVGDLDAIRSLYRSEEQYALGLELLAETDAALEDLERGETPVHALFDPATYASWTQEDWEQRRKYALRLVVESDKAIELTRAHLAEKGHEFGLRIDAASILFDHELEDAEEAPDAP